MGSNPIDIELINKQSSDLVTIFFKYINAKLSESTSATYNITFRKMLLSGFDYEYYSNETDISSERNQCNWLRYQLNRFMYQHRELYNKDDRINLIQAELMNLAIANGKDQDMSSYNAVNQTPIDNVANRVENKSSKIVNSPEVEAALKKVSDGYYGK